MTEHHFILHPDRPDIRQNCIAFIEGLPLDRKWDIAIEEFVPERTTSKNSGYWGYVLTPAAVQLGYESVEQLHRLVCMELYSSTRTAFAGKVYDVPNRTTTTPKTMNRKEFSDHVERAAALLIAQGVVLPAPETWFT